MIIFTKILGKLFFVTSLLGYQQELLFYPASTPTKLSSATQET